MSKNVRPPPGYAKPELNFLVKHVYQRAIDTDFSIKHWTGGIEKTALGYRLSIESFVLNPDKIKEVWGVHVLSWKSCDIWCNTGNYTIDGNLTEKFGYTKGSNIELYYTDLQLEVMIQEHLNKTYKHEDVDWRPAVNIPEDNYAI